MNLAVGLLDIAIIAISAFGFAYVLGHSEITFSIKP